MRNHEALKIKYIIWDHAIWSTSRPEKGWWRNGNYEGGANNSHTNHIHVSTIGAVN